MQAIRIHKFGESDVLEIDTLPDPVPGQGEVLVTVIASSVNPVDYKIRKGGYLPEDQLPITPGRDIAGVVRRCGPGVKAYEPGAEIFALLPPDRGGHAELVAVPEAACALKPERLDFVESAAVPLAALTAWQGLFDHGELRRGQSVLILGAAGGVGHMAVQFAKTIGAEVFATCGPDDIDFLIQLGVDHVIDYRIMRFEEEARDVDLVFDLVGGEVLDRAFTVLKHGGVLVSALQPPDPEKARTAGVRGVRYMAEPNGRQLTEIARLIDAGKVAPQVDRTYPLSQTAQAEDWLEHHHVRGKVVIKVH
jgi:NADPH:quinone reductase-like Zn-dependent oxidoreductase